MKKTDIQKLAKFLNNEELKQFADGSIMFNDKFNHFREWRPDKYIEDAEMLLDRLAASGYSWELFTWDNWIDKTILFYFKIRYGTNSINKSKYLAICVAVLKLIKEKGMKLNKCKLCGIKPKIKLKETGYCKSFKFSTKSNRKYIVKCDCRSIEGDNKKELIELYNQ